MENEEFEKTFRDAKAFFKSKNFIVPDSKLKAVISAVNRNMPIMAVGPTGCGKTLFFSLLAEFYGGIYFYQSLNGSITIHDLTQERILGDNGKFISRDMILAQALRAAMNNPKIKVFLQFDEVNAARAETLMAMHAVLDVKGELVLIYSDEKLKLTKNLAIVMSCNEGDEYQGINALNMAFQNRIACKLHFNYIEGKELTNMLVKKTGVDEDKVKSVVKVWEKYMTSKTMEQPIVSIRMLEYWLEMSKDLGLKDAAVVTFAGLIAKDEDDLIQIIEGDLWVNLT